MSCYKLPPEILADIFKYLPVYEVKCASDVSKQWCHIASNLVLIPKGHLLLKHAPTSIWKTPLHTIHIDGSQEIREDFSHINTNFQLTGVTTIVLYGQWTLKKLSELSECMSYVPKCTMLEIFDAHPAHLIVDFLLIRHDITIVRCFLRTVKHLRTYQKICDRFRKIHGLFEEVLLSLEIDKELQVYAPKIRRLQYPSMELTSNLTIHPGQLSRCDFDTLRDLERMKCLTLISPREIPKDILTSLSSSPYLKKLSLYDAKTISHDCWSIFFQSPLVASLEELSISGKSQIDSSIFDNLGKHYKLKKLYVHMSNPCFSDDCRIRTMLTWCPNIEILVLFVPFSLVGLEDLVNIDNKQVTKLRTFKVVFQLTPDMAWPWEEQSLEHSKDQIRRKVQSRLPGVSVSIECKTHLREFLCDDDDDFD